MARPRRFEQRIFLTLLVVALVPTALAVAAGAWALADVFERSGSAGPWAAVAGSGLGLVDALERTWPAEAPFPSELTRAVETHRSALLRSRDMSRLYAAVAGRALDRLPLLALALAAAVALLAWLAARHLARGFARPVETLVGWTEGIARDEGVPTGPLDSGVRELETLADALQAMSVRIRAGRESAVEAARLSTWTAMARRVAHEIKNPLTPMKLSAHQVLRRASTESDRGDASILLEEIGRLDALARSFVQVGRAPDGPPAPVDLMELARETADRFANGPIAVQVHGPPGPVFVPGHVDALRGALLNLVTNAVEACEEAGAGAGGGEAPVTVRVEAPVEGRARVVVEDRGPGLPPLLGDSLWNLDVTTKRRGSGIGLALVRQTVLVHGGTVDATDRPEGGARFTVWLPAPPDHGAAPASGPEGK
ncbi:MAG: HAMP domain-containing sensor histidine kinase [Gemmatimonadota bacterium]|nr:HAMP domain-containing histidine kinase [Gemmatimonadota bacterium]